MRITIKLSPVKKTLKLPIHHNHLIQSFIYRHLEKSLAEKLHNQGFKFEKRTFKLFTFSRLLPSSPIQRKNDYFLFPGSLYLKISSLQKEFIESLVTHLLKSPEVNLGGEKCIIESIEINPTPKVSFPLKIKALSPITIQSTLYTKEGTRKTYYYNPWEEEFSHLILRNLEKKMKAWKDEEIPLNPDIHYLKPLKVKKNDEKLIIYKGFIIKGWMGTYELNLPQDYFPIAYHAGLGAKNPQGFGMIEVVGNP